jgi:hypothetical protein
MYAEPELQNVRVEVVAAAAAAVVVTVVAPGLQGQVL